MRALVVGTALFGASIAAADDNRARVNYMLHCQGCHLPDAVGVEERVPRMKDFLGYFLHSDKGREFIVQVPGVATAQLPDDEIAELMNWLLTTYSKDQLPDKYRPYTEAEVNRLRASPEPSPIETRKRILQAIATDLPSLAADQHEYE